MASEGQLKCFTKWIFRGKLNSPFRFKQDNNKWLANHPKDALIFRDLDVIWERLKDTYTGDFRNLVYGDLPKEEAVLATLKIIKERLKIITWNVKV